MRKYFDNKTAFFSREVLIKPTKIITDYHFYYFNQSDLKI